MELLTNKLKNKPFGSTKFNKRQIIFFALAFALIGGYYIYSSFAAPAPCTIYVSPTGSGTGSSSSSPASLTSGINQTVAGSVVCLMGGTYNHTSNITGFKSGSSSSWITYRNYDSTPPVIHYNSSAGLSGGQFQLSGNSNWDGQHHIIFDGLTFDGNNMIGGAIFLKNGVHHVIMRNLIIKNQGATGLALNAVDYVTAENNQIYHVGYNQGWSSGISLWYGGNGGTNFGGPTAAYDTYAGFHNIIANNVISGGFDNSTNHSDGNGIIIDGGGANMPPALIINNVLYQNGGRGFENLGNSGNVWVVNNTAYSNGLDLTCGSGQCPDFMAHTTTNNHFVNNIAYGRKNNANYTTAYIYNNTSSTIASAKNLGFNGSVSGTFPLALTSDPKFLNRPIVQTTGTDAYINAVAPWNLGTALTLAAGSPAINAGVDPTTQSGLTSQMQSDMSAYLSTDVAGKPRSNGVIDLGAYEYYAPSTPPTINLTVTSSTVTSGTSTTVNWSTTNATSCTAYGGWTGSKATSGSFQTGNLTINTTYGMTCSNTDSSSNSAATVYVTGGSGTWAWDARAATLDPNSSTYMSTFTGYALNNPNLVMNDWAVATVDAGPNDPTYTIPRTDQGGTISVRIPLGTKPDPSDDGHLTVRDVEKGVETDFWQAVYDSTTGKISSTSAAVSFPLNAVNEQTTGWGGNAANTPLRRGLVTPEQILDGQIKQTLQFSTPQIGPNPPRYPALHNAPTCGSTCTNHLPEGTWMRLDPSLNVDALSIPAWQKTIAKALQDYGMVLRDNAGTFGVYAENTINRGGTAAWAGTGLSGNSAAFSASFPWASLQVLNPPNAAPTDTTPPTVSITAPSSGATVSGSSVTVSANATDNVGVTGVQFKLDGTNLSTEDTTSPYSITWNTTTASNGSHTLTAVARDAAGNSTTSSSITVTVSNAAPTKQGDVNNDGLVNVFDLSILLSDYGKTKAAAANQACDINNDNTINIFDLSILLSNYGS